MDLIWWVRRLTRGPPVILVSGLPRSGTSLVMQMLSAGGLPVVSDGVRGADEDNLRGYFEFERVKALEGQRDTGWLRECRGRALKVVSPLLRELPRGLNYQVIFVERELSEVLASQEKMLGRRGPETAAPDGSLAQAFEAHLRDVHRYLARSSCFRTLRLPYGEAIAKPEDTAGRLNRFLGGGLDVAAMAAAVDPTLYRHRLPPLG